MSFCADLVACSAEDMFIIFKLFRKNCVFNHRSACLCYIVGTLILLQGSC